MFPMFSPSLWFNFSFFKLHFSKSKICYTDEVQLWFSLFWLKLSMFCLENFDFAFLLDFIFLGLIFRPMIHFELILCLMWGQHSLLSIEVSSYCYNLANTFFSSLNCLVTFVKNQLTISYRSISGLLCSIELNI